MLAPDIGRRGSSDLPDPEGHIRARRTSPATYALHINKKCETKQEDQSRTGWWCAKGLGSFEKGDSRVSLTSMCARPGDSPLFDVTVVRYLEAMAALVALRMSYRGMR